MLELEYALLLREYGIMQRRCTELVNDQARQIEQLRALVIRLRGELIRRDTVIAALRDALPPSRSAIPPARPLAQTLG